MPSTRSWTMLLPESLKFRRQRRRRWPMFDPTKPAWSQTAPLQKERKKKGMKTFCELMIYKLQCSWNKEGISYSYRTHHLLEMTWGLTERKRMSLLPAVSLLHAVTAAPSWRMFSRDLEAIKLIKWRFKKQILQHFGVCQNRWISNQKHPCCSLSWTIWVEIPDS